MTMCLTPGSIGVKANQWETIQFAHDYGYEAVEGKMPIVDLHATMLHLLGLDHERLTYRYAGRDFRLTDVAAEVVRPIIA